MRAVSAAMNGSEHQAPPEVVEVSAGTPPTSGEEGRASPTGNGKADMDEREPPPLSLSLAPFTVSSYDVRLPLATGGGHPEASLLFLRDVLAVAPPDASESWAVQIVRLTIRHPRQVSERDRARLDHQSRGKDTQPWPPEPPASLASRSAAWLATLKQYAWSHPRLFAYLAHQQCCGSRHGICLASSFPCTSWLVT